MKRRACSKCGTNRQESSYTSPRGRVCAPCRKVTRRKSSRSTRLRTTYGITEEEYDLLLAAQGGCCAICGGKRRYKLHVEHDHAAEKAGLAAGLSPAEAARRSIRGLACARCNKLLRDAHDNAALLRACALYLQDPPARGVLDAIHH